MGIIVHSLYCSSRAVVFVVLYSLVPLDVSGMDAVQPVQGKQTDTEVLLL